MLKIGETLNSSIPGILSVLDPFNETEVQKLISSQIDAGAKVIDINTALCTSELSAMLSAAKLVYACGGVPMFDSPDERVLCEALLQTTGDAFLNSVTLTERRQALVPLIVKQLGEGRKLNLVALPVGTGLPQTIEERREYVTELVSSFSGAGVPEDAIYLDLLIEALATDSCAPGRVLDTLRFIKERYPALRTVCGLSNISFGLPERVTINAAFLSMLAAFGLDAVIFNAKNPVMRKTLAACEALLGHDDYCMEYLALYRALKDD